MRFSMIEETLKEFEELLSFQLSCANRCRGHIDSLKETIYQKDYEQLQKLSQEFEESCLQMEKIDQKRSSCFARLKQEMNLPSDADFYQSISKIEDKNRASALSSLFTQIRISVSHIQSSIWIVDSYLKAIHGVLNQTMSSLSPDNEVGIYSSMARKKSLTHGLSRQSLFLNFNA